MHIEETFDVIKRSHIATGHGGRARMVKELGKKYANVTRDSIEICCYLYLIIHFCYNKHK